MSLRTSNILSKASFEWRYNLEPFDFLFNFLFINPKASSIGARDGE